MSIGKLSTEEKALLDAVEAGEFESVLTESRKKELEAIASNTFKKDKRINIRISNRDLTAIQSRASEEGIPYQTLVSSIIHKYISGSLQDITANKKIQPTQKTRDWFKHCLYRAQHKNPRFRHAIAEASLGKLLNKVH